MEIARSSGRLSFRRVAGFIALVVLRPLPLALLLTRGGLVVEPALLATEGGLGRMSTARHEVELGQLLPQALERGVEVGGAATPFRGGHDHAARPVMETHAGLGLVAVLAA